LDARNRLMQEVAGFGHNALPFLGQRRERQVDLAMVEARRGWSADLVACVR
jgi:hypothetical protein